MDFEERARAVLPPHISAYTRHLPAPRPILTKGHSTGRRSGSGRGCFETSHCRPLDDSPRYARTDTGSGRADGVPSRCSPRRRKGSGPRCGSNRVLARHVNQHRRSFAARAGTGAPWWFQVYVTGDHALTEKLLERAVAHGARALLLTVDMAAPLPASVNPRYWPESPARVSLGNLTPDEQTAAGPAGLAGDPSINLDTISWLRDLSGLPVIVKGVLRADDARRCVDGGAAGVVVSTHGGRRGATISTARALPEIVAAIGGQAEVYADSGVRTAQHVAAAIAMGARATLVGRPVL